jgi:DNA-binding NtrC family response regulator
MFMNYNKMEDKLRIIPYSKGEKQRFKHAVPSPLPDKTSSFLLIGATGSGKSVVARNIIRIMGNNWKKPNRFLIQSTAELDETLTSKFPPENVFTKYSDDIYDGIIEIIDTENKERRDENRRLEEYVLVVDDMVGLIKNSAKIWSDFVKNRHHNISIIINTQRFRAIHSTTRANAQNYIVFPNINKKELDKIAEELNYEYSNKEFVEAFKEKVKGFDFLFINARNRQYLINFKTPLINKETKEENEEEN